VANRQFEEKAEGQAGNIKLKGLIMYFLHNKFSTIIVTIGIWIFTQLDKFNRWIMEKFHREAS